MANGYGGSSSSSSATSTTSLKRTYVFSGETKTAPIGYHYMPNGSLMSDIEHIERFGGKKPEIKQLVLDDSNIGYNLPSRKKFKIIADKGAVFSLWVKNVGENKFYNFETGQFQSAETGVLRKKMTRGDYTGTINFPVTSAARQYDFLLLADYTSGTVHAPYAEVRDEDGVIRANQSVGSDSLMLKKVIYSSASQILTITPLSVSGNTSFGSATLSGAATRSNFGGSIKKSPFTITVTTANGKAVRIDQQPSVFNFTGRITADLHLAAELVNESDDQSICFFGDDNSTVATPRSTDTVDGAVEAGRNVVMDTNVANKMKVGDRVTGTGISSSAIVTVTALNPDEDNVKEFSVSESVTVSDGVTLSFTPPHYFKYQSLDNIAYIPEGATILGSDADAITSLTNTSGVISTSVALTELTGKTANIVDAYGVPSVTSGGVLTFENKISRDVEDPSTAVADGETFYFYGYGRNSINTMTGWDLEITNLKAEITTVTTTTTGATSSSTAVGVTSGHGIMDDITIVSSPNMNVSAANPTVTNIASYDVSSATTATLTLSSAQTLESGETLTFSGAGQTVTITGDIKVLNVGRTSTIYLNIDDFLTATTETA